MNILILVLQFILSMILIICYYKFVELRKVKKYTKKSIPADLKVFIELTKVDVKKTSYKKLMKLVMIINAFIISTVFVLTNITKSLILKFVIAIPLILIIFIVTYKLIGYIFKKKGMTINES